jgi:hypothetical protein
MIEALDYERLHERTERVEIDDHALGGTLRLKRPRDRDVEPIGVTVKAPALARVMRQDVRRLEPELFTDLHDLFGFALDDCSSRSSRTPAPAGLIEGP